MIEIQAFYPGSVREPEEIAHGFKAVQGCKKKSLKRFESLGDCIRVPHAVTLPA
jgi:hypothetical protein